MVSDRSNGIYRCVFSKIGLKSSILGAALFVAALTASGGYVQSGYYQQATNQSAKHQRWAKNEIRAGCPSFSNLSKMECTYQASQSAQENERAEYDLYAQRTSALWAAIMAFAALLGIGLSGVGVYLVWTTFRETIHATEIAKDSLNAMIDAERATLRMGEYAEIRKAHNRPHMRALTIRINNVGKSNGTIRSVIWIVADNAEWPESFEHSTAPDLIVKKEDSGEIQQIIHAPPTDGSYFVMGSVKYETILGRLFDTHFCYWVSPNNNQSTVINLIDWHIRLRRWPGQPADT